MKSKGMDLAMKICMYEGYLRNQKQLCDALCISPCASRRETELAVLEEGWKRWGYELGNHLYGPFAFVLLDEQNQELFCARDPVGGVTFYYHLTPAGKLLYGADLSMIVNDPEYRKEIDPDALQLYLMFGYPVGEKTLYRGIRKLLPGRYLLYKDGAVRIEKYYRFPARTEQSLTEEEWAEKIDQQLQDILAEDRECLKGAAFRSFLSGGVDSSFLLASADVKEACGISYAEEAFSEADAAAETASFLDVPFHEIRITSEDFMEAVSRLAASTELPLADASSAAFSLGCRSAAMKGNIWLSGEGADEFFAGYHVYKRAEDLGQEDGFRYYGCSGIMEQKTAMQLLGQEQAFPCDRLVKRICEMTAGCDPLTRMLHVDTGLWLEGDILFSIYRNARAGGLTLLAPFADPRMMELAFKIPASLKRKDGCGKYILRKAAGKRLPHEIAFRPKVGFSVPVRIWMQEEQHRGCIEQALFGNVSKAFFDQELLRSFWASFLMGRTGSWQILYAVFVFVIWYETCFSEPKAERQIPHRELQTDPS